MEIHFAFVLPRDKRSKTTNFTDRAIESITNRRLSEEPLRKECLDLKMRRLHRK